MQSVNDSRVTVGHVVNRVELLEQERIEYMMQQELANLCPLGIVSVEGQYTEVWSAKNLRKLKEHVDAQQ